MNDQPRPQSSSGLWLFSFIVVGLLAFSWGLALATAFAHKRGDVVTWPTALAGLELAIAVFSALAVTGAGVIAAMSLVAQREAARRMERATLTPERLRFHAKLMQVSRALIAGEFIEHQDEVKTLRDQASALFDPTVRMYIVAMMGRAMDMVEAKGEADRLETMLFDAEDEAKLKALRRDFNVAKQALYQIDRKVFSYLADAFHTVPSLDS